jgi:hypothetical protein
MRKINWLDYTGVDTQVCVIEVNKRLPEMGVDDEDIISIQRQWNDPPVGTSGNVTLFVFYWSN